MRVGIYLACATGAFGVWPQLARAELYPLWEVGGGAAVLSFPDYRGANKQRSYVIPVPYLVYRGDVLQIDRNKVRGLLFSTERVEIDLSVNGSVPIRSANSPARQGMPNLDPTLELGPSLNLVLAEAPARYKLTLKLPVRSVIASDFHSTQNAGVLANPQLNLDVMAGQGWKLGLLAGALFGDRRYHGYFYNVAPQYAGPDRAAYSAPGGYSGAQLIAAASKRFNKLWVGAFVKYDNINQAAFEVSPLVKRQSNVAAGIGVAWIFAQSSQNVEAGE
jgi:MipA family protein